MPALRTAVRKIIRGESPEHNGRFVPTTAELAKAVRFEDGMLEYQRKAAARQIEAPKQETVVEITPEMRARRVQQLRQLGVRLKSMGQDA